VAPVPVPGDFAYAEQAAQEVAAELKAEAEQRAAEAGVQRPPGTSARPLLLHIAQAFMSCKFSHDAEC
jgi:hypothetical protein